MIEKQRTNKADVDPSRGGTQLVSIGATWHRVDFHLHTPGVDSFSCPDGADLKSASGRDALVKRYADQLKNQRISVCAITDYNGIRTEWFEPIREEAKKRDIVVLPGAEVSFRTPKYGLHMLAIFPETASPTEINSFLQALDRDPAKSLLLPGGKHRDIELTNINEQGALHRLRERFGCLLIPPHPDGSNGLCQSFRPADAAAFLVEIRPDALEHCPEGELRKLQHQPSVGQTFFTNLAQVEFSDPHRLEEIGTKKRPDGTLRATYLKLSATDLDALRLALHDPCTRLAVGSVPQPAHARIRLMEVSSSGFLGNLTIAWNDDLNVVIGGRGAGKSAILETLRYALGLEPYSEHSYRSDLVHHALGSGGKVSLTLEQPIKNGKTLAYRVARVWGEEPRVFELPEKPVSVHPTDLFEPAGGPTVFGQREIYAVSASEDYRLRLLDDLIGEEATQRAMRVEESLESLRTNARAILDKQRQLAKREEHRQRLKTIEHQISVYEAQGVVEKLKAATTLRSDGQHLRSAVEAVERARLDWGQVQQNTAPTLTSATRNLRKGQSAHKAILDEAATALETLERGLRDLSKKGEELFKEAVDSLSGLRARWQQALRPLEDEINRIKQEAKTETLDPDRLLSLTEERAAIAPLIEELDRVEEELKALHEKRLTLIAAIRDRRHQEFDLRRRRADEIGTLLKDRLHLGVEFKGQKDDYKKRLFALLKGSGVSADAVERLAAPDATDGLLLAEAICAGSARVQERFVLTPAMAERLVKWFTDDESRLFELETVIPGDALRVDLRVEGELRTLDRLSPGQRATAILLLLFALQGRVLVLDQPEDDLDNRFVYEDVVQILREQKGLTDTKGRRQIITATHNPNIPVIGDAELVLALEMREGRAQPIGRASIDDREIRELIKAIMEGGEDAFRRRAEKYGGIL